MKLRTLSCSVGLLFLCASLPACSSDAESEPDSGSGLPNYSGNVLPADNSDSTSNGNSQDTGTVDGQADSSDGPTNGDVTGTVNEDVNANLGLDEGQSTEDGSSSDDSQTATDENGTVDEPVVEVPAGPPVTLRDAADLSGRLVGVALATFKLNRAGYGESAQDFNFLTHENDMKWQVLEPQPGQFNFGNADTTIEFAEANNMLVKGHTLVWHSQLPGWVRALDTRQEALDAMTNHITTVVERYRGRIHSYDVVNEAFTDGGNPRLRGSGANDAAANDGSPTSVDSVFRRLIGEDYIDRAFQIANATDPDALLFYNDYNGEGTSAKANAIFGMVQGLVQRGVPIDGVGLQMHINAGGDNQRSANDIAQNIERITNLGLQVHITEMDARLCGNGSIEQRRQQQSDRFADVVRVCTDEPLCTAITMWGVADPDSWRNGNCDQGGTSEPLLFDANYQRKPAYEGVFNALLNASTDASTGVAQ